MSASVAPHPMTEVRLVEDICGSFEFVGNVRQGHITDAEPAEVVHPGGQRPDRRFYPGGGRSVQ